MSEPRRRPRWRRYLLDWKVWLGIAIPVAALAYTVHDVEFASVVSHIQAARLLPILLIVPVQLLALWLRAYRWSFFTASLAEQHPGIMAHFLATSVGSFALNVLPFRIGELARPWALARETEVGGTAALGTVLLERAIDLTTLSLLGGALLFFQTQALPGWVQSGAIAFAALSVLPFGFLMLLRWRRELALELIGRALSPLPERFREPAVELVLEVCRGLESLRTLRDGIRVAGLSALMWFVVIPAPFALGLLAFDVQLPPSQFLLAVMTCHVFTALAVAAPSAPGFFGVYHFACREALALFGVPATVGVAFGSVVHLSYWLPVTLVGGLAAAQIGARIADLADPTIGKAAPEAHR